MQQDDHILVTQAQAGDPQAFRQLVERYQRRVYGIALGVLHNAEDAMDVAQEAFIKVHRYLDRFKGSSSFFTWLYRITINLCIDHLRKEGKAQTVDYDDSLDHQDHEPAPLYGWTQDMHPGRAADRKELQEMILQALQFLSANHRAVIIMREVEGMNYAEIAQVMQCSKGTIMSRLFHARRHLQEALQAIMKDHKIAAA